MKNIYLKSIFTIFLVLILSFNVNSNTLNPIAKPVITRGPYLQMGRIDGITIRWRTDIASSTKVTCGTTFGTYPIVAMDNALTKEHIIRVNSLTADTKYYYTIGDLTTILQSDVANQCQCKD
jgi:hypothetical protein